jgi:hypothetical protein
VEVLGGKIDNKIAMLSAADRFGAEASVPPCVDTSSQPTHRDATV